MRDRLPPRSHPLATLVAPGLICLAVVAISAWSLTFASRVSELRGQVETRVGWLIELREVDELLLAEDDDGTEAAERLYAIADRIRPIRPERAADVEQVARLAATDTTEALAASGRIVDSIRAENAVTSAHLGSLVGQLNGLVAASLGLGVLALALLLWGWSRNTVATEQTDRARALEAQLEFLIGASPAVLYTASASAPHDIRFVSRNVARVFGHIGDVITDRLWMDPEQRDIARRLAADAARNGRAVGEYEVAGPAGHPIWIRDECRLPADGDRSLLVGCLTDVTDRRLAEQAAQRALEDTEVAVDAAVQERDFMVSAASHDLSEPIRKIRVFAELLSTRLGDDLDEDAAQFLGILTDSAGRLQALVRDLLDYSQIGGEKGAPARLDTNAMVAQVLSDLSVHVEETGAEVEVDDLPPVWGDRAQLQRVFLNLIENALSYSKPGEAPRIRIDGEQQGDRAVIRVSDHGIGFENHFADRLVEPFFRLQGRSESPGTGIGLAICSKIVERHGGTLVPRGRPGEGATFTLRLPSKDAVSPERDV